MADIPQIVRTKRGVTTEADFRFMRDSIPEDGNKTLREYRQTAWDFFSSTPIPTVKEEAWRRTDLRNLRPETYQLPTDEINLHLPPVPDYLSKPLTADQHGGQVILTPGGSQVFLDENLKRQGVVFTDLKTAARNHADIVDKILGKIVKSNEGKFAGLTAALGESGVLLYVPRGVEVDQPLHSLLWGPGTSLVHLSHLLVYLEEKASVTYIHESASPKGIEQPTIHSGIVEILVGSEANLKFVELQSWGENIWNFSHERAHIERNGNLDWIFGAIGSHTTKNFSELELAGIGSSGRMSGFYFTDHNQHLDHDTQQNHLAPNTTSDLLFKGALLDESRSVWQGMIYVAPGANKTDGYQANRNLVLSNKARADSIPGLEILADDVRCTHGATVGKIDTDQIFYLLSRGIPRLDAEKLIVEGFFDPIMQRIPFEGVRKRFQEAIEYKMETYTSAN